jgi:glycosyltransferase involved in cell wall biosynthesis
MLGTAGRDDSRPLLSAVLIVRDEETVLGRCLGSLAGVVDEIVVVDTGSTDRTVEIAEAHGCVVDRIAWTDDFAAARNRSLDVARGTWVLMIDADEVIADGTAASLRGDLDEAADTLAFTVAWRARPGQTPAREVRIWRRRADLRFRGRIHEHVVADLGVLVAAGAGTVGTSDVVVDHDGYEGDQQSRRARDLPLLDAAIAEGDDRPYLHEHRGRLLRSLGRHDEAFDAWRTGAALAVAQDRRRAQDAGCHASLLAHGAAAGLDVDSLRAEAVERFDFAFVVWACLLHGEQVGDDDLVVRCADRLIAGPRAQDLDVGVDPRIHGPWPHVARGRIRLRRGDGAGALHDLRIAEAQDPGVLEYRVLRVAAEARAGARPDAAPGLVGHPVPPCA